MPTNHSYDEKAILNEIVSFDPMKTIADETSPLMAFLQKIPWLTEKLKLINNTAGCVSEVPVETNQTPNVLLKAAKTLPVVSVALNSLDFISYPLLYLAALYCGTKVPFTLDNNAKWLYSAVLVGLGLVSVFVPPAGFVIGLGFAATFLASSLFFFKTKRDQYLEEKQDQQLGLDGLQELLAAKEKELLDLSKQAQTLLNATPVDEAAITALKQEFDQKKDELQQLQYRKTKLERNEIESTKSEMNTNGFFVGWSVAYTAASVLSFLAIPAAPIVLLALGFVASGYTLVDMLTTPTQRAPELNQAADMVSSSYTMITDSTRQDNNISPRNRVSSSALPTEQANKDKNSPNVGQSQNNSDHSVKDSESQKLTTEYWRRASRASLSDSKKESEKADDATLTRRNTIA